MEFEFKLLKCFSHARLVTFLSFEDVLAMVGVSRALKEGMEEMAEIWVHLAVKHFGAFRGGEAVMKQLVCPIKEGKMKKVKGLKGRLARLHLVELANRFYFVSRSSLFRFWNVQINPQRQGDFMDYGNFSLITLANICKIIQLTLSTESHWRHPSPDELSFKDVRRPGIPFSRFHAMPQNQPMITDSLTFQFHGPMMIQISAALKGTTDPHLKELLSVLSLHMMNLILLHQTANENHSGSILPLRLGFEGGWSHSNFFPYFVEVVGHLQGLISGGHGGRVDYHFYGKAWGQNLHMERDLCFRDVSTRLYESLFVRGSCKQDESVTEILGRPLISYTMILNVLALTPKPLQISSAHFYKFIRENAYAAWKSYLRAEDGYWGGERKSHQKRRLQPFRLVFTALYRGQHHLSSGDSNLDYTSYELMVIADLLDCVMQYEERKPSLDRMDIGALVFSEEAAALLQLIRHLFVFPERGLLLVNNEEFMATYRRFEQYLQSLPGTVEGINVRGKWDAFLSSMQEVITQHPPP